MPLIERLRGLVEGIDTPIAAFARDGLFVGASDAARALLGFRNLTEAGLDAGAQRRAEAAAAPRRRSASATWCCSGSAAGADVGLVALLAPGAAASEHLRPQVALSPTPNRPRTIAGPIAPAEHAVGD